MGLVGFECPLKGEKKLLLGQENLDSVSKSIPIWCPATVLNLKMQILTMRALQAKKIYIFEIFHLKLRKRMENELTSP